jgi:hypothetical protein
VKVTTEQDREKVLALTKELNQLLHRRQNQEAAAKARSLKAKDRKVQNG